MFYQQHLKQYAAQCLAEFFATFLSILLGNLSVAQNKFSKPANQSLFGINLSFSVGVYVALMVAGPISGWLRSLNEKSTLTNKISILLEQRIRHVRFQFEFYE